MKYVICFFWVMANVNMLAASDCVNGVKKIIDGRAYTKKLEPDEQVFGFYTCLSCGNRSIAKPDPREVKVNCDGCGVAHTTETVDAPAYFRKTDSDNNTDVYIVDWEPLVQAGSIEDKASRSGLKVQCPFCAGSTFSVHSNCPNCGASVLNAPKIMPGPENTITLLTKKKVSEQVAEAKLVNRPTPVLVKKVLVTKQRALVAGAGTVVGTAAVIYWTANYNYQTTGTIIHIDEATHQVTVAYVDYYGEAQKVLLSYDPSKSSPWYLTEEMTLYFVRWPANQGAERMNGEVYPFDLNNVAAPK